jgi:uncharacterized phiE125 gp8 family phage protein
MIVLTTRRPEINSRVETPGAYTSLTLATFKQWLKWDEDDTSEDTIMQIDLTSAIKETEAYTRRVIDPATWRSYLTGFYDVTLDISPIDVSSLTVNYFDENGIEQVLADTEYEVIDNGQDDYAKIRFTGDMPDLSEDITQNVFLEYDAGYTTYPTELTAIILQYAADLFETRTNDVSGSLDRVTMDFHRRLFPYKML